MSDDQGLGSANPNQRGPAIILASASLSRRSLLERAGVPLTVEAANVDEDEVKIALAGEGASAAQVADSLAELKAVKVSRRHPDALVIGADQVLECEGAWYDKPKTRAEAEAHLQGLSGRTHHLQCGTCVAREGQRIWHRLDRADMTMRPLSDRFIAAYLDSIGGDAYLSVGAYQLEGEGAQLFSRVAGDYFTILGLPLLVLLDFLRAHGAIST